jgi:hypothetical protein
VKRDVEDFVATFNSNVRGNLQVPVENLQHFEAVLHSFDLAGIGGVGPFPETV